MNTKMVPSTTSPMSPIGSDGAFAFDFGKKSFLIGGQGIHIVAGPCSIENQRHFDEASSAVLGSGAAMFRGGIYKLRTDHLSFQGLGEAAFSWLPNRPADRILPFVTEITDPRQIEKLGAVTDVFQVGSRNMYNYELLKELGRTHKPVLLKRAFSATVDEWIKAAGYITSGGNERVILCERGVRGFDSKTRNILDLGAVAYLKTHTKFPVWVDPSHGTGRADLVASLSKAAIAAGADGLLIEAHHSPTQAMSDADQAIPMSELKGLIDDLDTVAKAIGRHVDRSVNTPSSMLDRNPMGSQEAATRNAI